MEVLLQIPSKAKRQLIYIILPIHQDCNNLLLFAVIKMLVLNYYSSCGHISFPQIPEEKQSSCWDL